MDASRQFAAWMLLCALAGSAAAQKTIGSGQTVYKHRVAANALPPEVAKAEAALDKKDYPTAEKLLQEYTAAHPGDYRAWYDLGYLYTVTERNPQAIEAYRKSVAADPNIFEANLNLGLALAAAGDPQAETFLRAATRLKPASDPQDAMFRAWFALGRVTATSKPADAAAAFAEAAKLHPKDPKPHFFAGTLLEKQKDYTGAEREWQQALALDPSNAETVAVLANLYMETRRLDQAEAMIRKYLEFEPRNATAHLQLGRVLAAEGKGDAAAAEYQAAQQIAPQDPEVHREMAQTYYNAGKFKEAAAEFEAMLPQSPNDARLYFRTGDALLRAKDFPRAQAALLKAVQLKPDLVEAYEGLALAASENKQYDVVVKVLDIRARMTAETPSTWFMRATALDHLRNYKDASAAYRQFLATSNGKFPEQEWQARHRLIAIDPEKKR